jgi:hypothetical protein
MATQEIRARREGLEADRQRLSFDALTDDNSRRDLLKTEREITELRAEAERVALAKIESNRREQEAQEIAGREARAGAQKRADELGELRQKADARLQRAASGFASALAVVHSLSSEQSTALNEAGRGWQSLDPSPGQLQRLVAGALMEVGAPTGWLG